MWTMSGPHVLVNHVRDRMAVAITNIKLGGLVEKSRYQRSVITTYYTCKTEAAPRRDTSGKGNEVETS